MAAMPVSNPLTQKDCDCLDQALASIAITRELLGRCQNCGLDVGAAQKILDEQEKKATAIKAEFFPNRV